MHSRIFKSFLRAAQNNIIGRSQTCKALHHGLIHNQCPFSYRLLCWYNIKWLSDVKFNVADTVQSFVSIWEAGIRL